VARVQGSDAILAGERAKAILEPLIFRRTKNSTIEGKPILSLPEKYIQLVTLEFSKDEREVILSKTPGYTDYKEYR
jgi:SNF2 family DNA or RNA helicase